MTAISAHSLDERFAALSVRLDQSVAEYRQAIQEQADAERLYELAKANAFLSSTGTVAEREAAVTKVVADERHRAHLAEGMAKAALENVRNLRSQVSALQTIAAQRRSEEYARKEAVSV